MLFDQHGLSAGNNNPTDLYGLSYRIAPTVLASDWYTGPGDLRAEKRREDGLRRAGWRFARWTSDEVWGRDDAALAERLFAALLPRLPREVTTAEGESAVLVGLNPRFRACRYRDGQSFQRHRDGAHAPSEDVRSERTLMVYLTDGEDHLGGRTRFYDSADPSAPPLTQNDINVLVGRMEKHD